MPMQSTNSYNGVKNKGPDPPIEMEIKAEKDFTGKSHVFICPKCEAHFVYESCLIEHIEQNHNDIISKCLHTFANNPAYLSKLTEEVRKLQTILAKEDHSSCTIVYKNVVARHFFLKRGWA